MTVSIFQWPPCGFPETLSVRSAKSAKSPLSTPEPPRVRGAKSARSPFVTFGTAYSAYSQGNKAEPNRVARNVPPDTAALSSEVSA